MCGRLRICSQICCSTAPALVYISHRTSTKLVQCFGGCPNSADLDYGSPPLSTARARNLGAKVTLVTRVLLKIGTILLRATVCGQVQPVQEAFADQTNLHNQQNNAITAQVSSAIPQGLKLRPLTAAHGASGDRGGVHPIGYA